MRKERKIGNHINEIIAVFLILLSIFLMVVSGVMLKGYTDGLEEQAQIRVESYTYETGARLRDGIDRFLNDVTSLSERVAECETEQQIIDSFEAVKKMTIYSDVQSIRFFHRGFEYYDNGYEYDYNEASKIVELKNVEEATCAGIVYNRDREHDGKAVGFCVPVKDNPLIDSLVIMYPIGAVVKIFDDADTEKLNDSEMVAFCEKNGGVVKMIHKKEGSVSQSQNIIESLTPIINNKATIDEIEKCMKSKGTSIFPFEINGERHIMSVSGSGENGGGFSVIGMYRASDIYENEYIIVNTTISILVIIFIVVISVSVVFIVYRSKIDKRIYNAVAKDAELDCYTAYGFKKASETILKKHKATDFSLIAMEIKFFNYITEHFGEEVTTELLKYMRYILNSIVTVGEEYGYSQNGIFYILMHYRDRKTVVNRLNSIYYNSTVFPIFKEKQYALKLAFGVYEIDREKNENIDDIIGKAVMAKNSLTLSGVNERIKFFTEGLQKKYLQEAHIESKAEFAAENDEFKVFYQPKINIKSNKMDSAEALVRWYNPETQEYRPPVTFIPLFEANGFIIRLDRLVYRKVLEFISNTVKEGKRVYPVSVNVSRITAVQENFMEYYVGLKREYKIPDKFITLEFTESATYENYDYLSTVIKKLQENGFLCSTDDFGTGTSSFKLLKRLNVDEIKLDAMFIKEGVSINRDNLILRSVIQTAKSMNMKVVQEGVETVEDVRRLKEFGCDVIQGYYFSKPLPEDKYLEFISDEENIKKYE